MFEKDSFKFSLPMLLLLLLLLLLLQTTGLNSSVHCSICPGMPLNNDAAAASAVDMLIIFPRKVRHKNNCAAVVVVVVFIFFSFLLKYFAFLICELFTSILSQFTIVTTIIGIPYFTTVKRVSDQVL